MIITTPGSYPIHPPITALNSKGVYYQVRIIEVTEVDMEAQKIFCQDLGWVGWNLPVISKD
jgi:hypothetical protein